MKNILFFIWVTCVFYGESKSQTINYVNNGSFEDCVNCQTPPYDARPVSWSGIDTTINSFFYCSTAPPLSNLPYFAYSYQYPKSGNNIILSNVYCVSSPCTYTNSRLYPMNRLKMPLIAGATYCVKFSVLNRDVNKVGIDAYGICFSNGFDTITYEKVPLTYLTPQIENVVGNCVTDTLNWTTIQGTFTAGGGEKFALIGNFRSNAATNYSLIAATPFPLGTDVFYDDVSCININASAFAGPDQAFKMGDSLYLGSPRDFAVDELCRWYQLPGNIALDTAAGIWIKPTETSTYVVRQEICGLVKWDTAVIFKDAVGLGEDNGSRKHFSVYPNPTASEFSVRSDQKDGEIDICIYDVLNRIVLQEKLTVKNHETKLKVELNNGIYLVSIRSDHRTLRSKQLIIQR